MRSLKNSCAQTWEISNGSITQVWSDAVEIIGAKNNYEGGNSTDGYKIDFRANKLGYKGSLFSWRAVVETANLCPPPWRVPTEDDFINLDKAMGGSGNNRYNSEVAFVNDKYLGDWGGAFGGGCLSDGTLFDQGSWADYWSQSEEPANCGFRLKFGTIGHIYPQNCIDKDYGFTLRCVRN